MAEMAILNDVTQCTGCRACQVACKQWNNLPAEATTYFAGPGYQNPARLSSSTWNMIKFIELKNNGGYSWAFRRHSCMHCTESPCVKLCPVEAIGRTEEGVVVIDEERCLGCPVCVNTCPFDAIAVDVEVGKARKCDLCSSRFNHGLLPACVKTCPTDALQFGSRSELLKQAKTRVRDVRGARLYGEHQLGGLHILYILPDTEDVFELPRDPKAGDGLITSWLLTTIKPALATLFLFSWLAEQKPDDGTQDGEC